MLTLRRSGTSNEFFLMHHKSKKNYSKWRQIPKRLAKLQLLFSSNGLLAKWFVCPHFVKNGELKLSRNKLFIDESFRRNHIHFSLICCYIYVGIQSMMSTASTFRSVRSLWLYWFGNNWSSRSTTRFAKELLFKADIQSPYQRRLKPPNRQLNVRDPSTSHPSRYDDLEFGSAPKVGDKAIAQVIWLNKNGDIFLNKNIRSRK